MRTALRARFASFLNATTAVWAGVTLVAVGFTAIFYTWARVAGLLNVAEQVPYMVAGGIVGLALIIVGITVVDVAVRRQDRQERLHQMAQLDRALEELHDALETQQVETQQRETGEDQDSRKPR